MRRAVVALLLAVAACGSGPAPQGQRAPDPGQPVEAPSTRTPTALRVDHAWVKDAPSAAEQAKNQAEIERLRALVLAGGSFDAAWNSLGVAPAAWHIGEGETYPYDMIPAAARELPVGQVSSVLPGDGGLHLFRILAREYAE